MNTIKIIGLGAAVLFTLMALIPACSATVSPADPNQQHIIEWTDSAGWHHILILKYNIVEGKWEVIFERHDPPGAPTNPAGGK
jgi:hypothetical protein